MYIYIYEYYIYTHTYGVILHLYICWERRDRQDLGVRGWEAVLSPISSGQVHSWSKKTWVWGLPFRGDIVPIEVSWPGHVVSSVISKPRHPFLKHCDPTGSCTWNQSSPHLLTASPSLEASGVEDQGFRAWRNLDVKGAILGGT